jgi:sarcosine oxidase delta subunit
MSGSAKAGTNAERHTLRAVGSEGVRCCALLRSARQEIVFSLDNDLHRGREVGSYFFSNRPPASGTVKGHYRKLPCCSDNFRMARHTGTNSFRAAERVTIHFKARAQYGPSGTVLVRL